MITEATTSPQRDLAKLLQFLVRINAPAVCSISGDDVLIGGEGVALRTFRATVVHRAATLGLLTRTGATLRASPAATAYLRRLLADPDSAFQDQHRDIASATVETPQGRENVRRNCGESPLGSIARLKDRDGASFLTADALAAGERLHADFTRAHLQPRMTMRYEPHLAGKTKGHPNAGRELSDSALSARMRVNKALEAMGPELAGVALDVCCFEKGLELVERERQWPVRSAKLMLRAALMTLARYYAPPKGQNNATHAWGDAGFRPSMPLRGQGRGAGPQ